MYHVEYLRQKEKQEELLSRKNEIVLLQWHLPALEKSGADP